MPIISLLTKKDGVWYLEIADHGYDASLHHAADGGLALSYAFHPLYPWLIRLASLTGMPSQYAAVVVALAAGLVAAWGIFAIGDLVGGRRAGVILAVAWGCLPQAVVQSMAYSETTFVAAAAWSLYALLTARWIIAGMLAAVSGLVRPTAVALVASVVLASAAAIIRGRSDGWIRPLIAAGLAPIGLIAYWGWVALVAGRADGWFYLQREKWHSFMDGGRYTVHALKHAVLVDPSLVLSVVTAVVVATVLLTLAMVVRRGPIPWPLIVYAAATVLLVVVSAQYYHAKARLMMPAFPVLLPLALMLCRLRPAVVIAGFTVAAIASAWFGSYVLIDWPRSP